ncbi:MAG: hypothetical protein ACP5M4_08715 [Acidobacteriaceae bacterium]
MVWSAWRRCAWLLAVVLLAMPAAQAVSCKTQSMMTETERDALANAARMLVTDVQQGNSQALRAATVPAIANDFGAIEASAQNLQPLIAHATITVDSLYGLDAADVAPGTAETDFACGIPGSLMSVGLNFHNLPAGQYAVAILHATGVAQPQMFTLVLEQSNGQWMLAGFFSHPMTLAGHDGIWFWTQARAYAQRQMKWNAWLYYAAAKRLLRPVGFLTSPNLEMLQHEAAAVKPEGFPFGKPVELSGPGGSFAVTQIAPTDALGPLDISVEYTPTAAQAGQLNDPVAARKQVTEAMLALLAQHPELRVAFQGIWMQAEEGGSQAYALELPMTQIQPEASGPAAQAGSGVQ